MTSPESLREIFAPKLLHWYQHHKRNLPWRHTNDPYRIWLSEVILQQTRVKQGLPYYLAFVENYPTVFDLAQAEEREVLRLWQGLGYYSRARNMHQTAKMVVTELGGKFPDNYAGLLQLKGVGPYIAAAVASFAFREPVAVVDGNVFRVLARLMGIETDIASHEAKKVFGTLANELISREKPDEYNQAIMEFGALLCTPANPQCMFCPVNTECTAFATGRQQVLPVKSRKQPVKERYFHYLVFSHHDTVAMRARTAKDIWLGLFDFFLIESDTFEPIHRLLGREELQPVAGLVDVAGESAVHTHLLSHQRVQAKFWHLPVRPGCNIGSFSALGVAFYSLPEIEILPKPVLISNYLKEHFF
jgi:A/G-specific adenine glycosylase